MKKIDEKALKHMAVCIGVFTAIIFTMLIMAIIQKDFDDVLINRIEYAAEFVPEKEAWSYNYNLEKLKKYVDGYFRMWLIYASVFALLDASLIIIYASSKKKIKKKNN